VNSEPRCAIAILLILKFVLRDLVLLDHGRGCGLLLLLRLRIVNALVQEMLFL
jgi:hypothetical protein